MDKKIKRILISAFSCDPYRGSESACGWYWASEVAKQGHEVHCLTRASNQKSIERHTKIPRLHIHYLSLPSKLETLYRLSESGMYLYYFLWQILAYKRAKFLHKQLNFDLAQHVSWGNISFGSFLYKLGIPFIFGPTGGGQKAPTELRKYFLGGWKKELIRNGLSRLLLMINPGCFEMLRKAKCVIVSNQDTYEFARRGGARKILYSLDAALSENFYPSSNLEREIREGQLKLLWVGRLMPRKGLALVLDVMKELLSYPGISLTVVGGGELEDELKIKIKENGLENKVGIKGMVPFEQIRHYYASHEVFFFTSLRDSCPCQIIEAMAFGLPVITLDLHGQAEIVSEQTGVKVPVRDASEVVKALSKAVLDLSQNPKKYFSMSRAAYDFALKQTWKKKIEEITKALYGYERK